MSRWAFLLVFVAISILPARAETAASQPLALEARSAARALDAIPAIFAISQNFEGVDFDVDGLVDSLIALEDYGPAQEQLSAAAGVYDFSGYSEWLATIRTMFATYAYARSDVAKPATDAVVEQIVEDPAVSKAQKDALLAALETPAADVGVAPAVEPSEQNLRVVIGLSPQIETAIETMQAMR